MSTDLRITVKNVAPDGGVFLTPFYFGFHDGSFDIFTPGQAASAGLEQLAEDGMFDDIAAERLAADADSQGAVVAGAGGPIAAGETTSSIVSIDGDSNPFVSFGAMILPSNDAFVATFNPIELFDADGDFVGASLTTFSGAQVWDAGTEVNTEEDAAFLNQTAPDTGVDEGGVVELHPGFNGSLGNPVGEGDQNILGGTNAFGEFIDPVAADFTQPGSQIAEVHINTVVERNGTNKRDVILGRRDDDIVDAGDGADVIFTRAGWDVIDAGDGRDFVRSGSGDDIIDGGRGADDLFGGAGDDVISGGNGRDFLAGNRGNDVLNGGGGDDVIRGGLDEDVIVFADGDDDDTVFGFRDGDVLALDVDGVDDFHDLLDVAKDKKGGTLLDFGHDSIFLVGVDVDDLAATDFVFA